MTLCRDAAKYLEALGVIVDETSYNEITSQYISFRTNQPMPEIIHNLDSKSCMDDGEESDLPLGAGTVSDDGDGIMQFVYWDRGVETLTRQIIVIHNTANNKILITLQQYDKDQAWRNK